MVEQKGFYSPVPPNLHLRALQTLVALRHRGEPQFWRRQFSIGRDAYATATLGGLAICGIAEAFDWLKGKATEPAAFAALMRLLPKLAEEYPQEIVHYIQALASILPSSWNTELGQLASKLGIRVSGPSPSIPARSRGETETSSVISQFPSNLPRSLEVLIPGTLSDTAALPQIGLPAEEFQHPYTFQGLFRLREKVCRDPKHISNDERERYVEIAQRAIEGMEIDDELAWQAELALNDIRFRGLEDNVADRLRKTADINSFI
jgi:hypothetical protein